MAEATRIDSHQHFWRLERGDYGWLTKELAPLYRDFAPDDLRPYLKSAGVRQTVVVQAAPTLAETRYLLQLAEETDFIVGVVGWVDMEKPDVAIDLEALAEQPYLLGIRPMLQDLPDPTWMLRAQLQPVYDKLVELGLRFDALVKPQHLQHLYKLLRRHPHLVVIIDHGAKPDIAGGAFQPWADDIAAIAADTGAFCKLSGLLTEAGAPFTYDKVEPYMRHLLHCFGAERLLWGSDWPVLELAADYDTWNSFTDRFLRDLSAEERQLILGNNAANCYGL
ncbi:MAG: amidohydrolase family protein [Gammaproteobacteria bacterium]|nr:amidohydrolase family protein [Gammaproteobacteria bacterium]MCY4210533.1 amidohydrolase family protein [Gammaproteobacteria bacterium]MCY4282263.1 amidohydrolase family protein [Gammaproteobacteria bacterium]MCY4337501.1 amidohydrolase family protein [Gammaproteobacteria bacterium]